MSRDFAFRPCYRLALTLVLLFVMSLVATVAVAAEDCADTSAKLIQYLNKSETQSSPYKIKVLAGSYVLSGAKYQWFPTASTTIEGGYVDCGNRGSDGAALTTIDSTALFPRFQVLVQNNSLTIDGFTFVGGGVTAFSAGELSAGDLTISHVRFTQTHPSIQIADGEMSLDEVLIDHTPSDPAAHCSAYFGLYGDNSVEWKFVTIQAGNGDDVCVDNADIAEQHNTVRIYNSIFWGGNFRMEADQWPQGDIFDVKIFNSVFEQAVVAHGTFSESNSLHVDPLWINAPAGDFRLQVPPNPISPAINSGAGAAEVPGGISATDTDIAGNPRVIGSAPDMGAYESAVDDSNIFWVYTTADCSTPLNQQSCGSLRDAIARATAPTATAPSKIIRFWIDDANNQPICPAIINISSGLPDITSNVTIDGYSQGSIQEIDPPLSWTNTDPDVFNANLCVDIIGPGSGFGLRVPAGSNGSLTLRGVGIGNFLQGVMLLGGANHQIAGNQFGGTTGNGVYLHGFTTTALNISPTSQSSGALIVGGENIADRNVFLNANSFGGIGAKAILMDQNVVSDPDHCQVLGNLIGILPDGTNAPGNDYGLLLEGDGCTIKGNWIAGDHDGAIWIQGQHYIVQGNYIGVVPRSFSPQNNAGFAILIDGSNNEIGPSATNFIPPVLFQVGPGNYISDMAGQNIVVDAPGTGNTIRGNVVVNTTSLAVDLGGDGPTANDAADADTGPNDLQNFPSPYSLTWVSPPQPGQTNPATIKGTLIATPSNYNIDVFVGSGCDASGRGSPGLWIRRYDVSVPDASVTTDFEIPVGIPDYFDPTLAAISLTATSELDGSTSEISTCLPIDTIFRGNFEM